MSGHLKRLASPETWNVPRKTSKLIIRPYGYTYTALPVGVILREILKVSKNRHENKRIINSKKISLDGKAVTDDKAPAGIMSVLSVQDAQYRVLLNAKGKLFLKKLAKEEAALKPAKVVSKKSQKKGKQQLGFHDGRTMITEQDVNVSDTILFHIPDFKVSEHLKLEKNAAVYVIGGSNVGSTGTVENISKNVTLKIGENTITTGKENIFVIGKQKPSISVK
ncbi:hypothetical protein HYX10_05390 [Candidatus Woesearchaeota archaeon]|nr:hypothetical protein [Candidatus Woesearchaeota archaeon]